MSEKLLWFVIFLALYVSFCVFWAIRGSKKSTSPGEYYLANRDVSSWVFFFAATVATFGGLVTLSQTNTIFFQHLYKILQLGTSFSLIISNKNHPDIELDI